MSHLVISPAPKTAAPTRSIARPGKFAPGISFPSRDSIVPVLYSSGRGLQLNKNPTGVGFLLGDFSQEAFECLWVELSNLREYLTVEGDTLLLQRVNECTVVLKSVITECSVNADDMKAAHGALFVAAVAERVLTRVFDSLERLLLLS